MEIGTKLYVTNRSQWRSWLRKHHASAHEIWLVYYKPRRPGSLLSELNKERVRRLVASGRMTKAGLEKISHHLQPSRGRSAASGFRRFVFPPDIIREIRKSAEAWKAFSKFPASYKRVRIGWIDGARDRPRAFRQRLRYFIRMTALNKRFGMT